MKCELKFLITIGDNKDILENTQKYFKVNINPERFTELKSHLLHSLIS